MGVAPTLGRSLVNYKMHPMLWCSYLCTGTCSPTSSSWSLRRDPSSAPGDSPGSLPHRGVLSQTSTYHLSDLVEEPIRSPLRGNTAVAWLQTTINLNRTQDVDQRLRKFAHMNVAEDISQDMENMHHRRSYHYLPPLQSIQ